VRIWPGACRPFVAGNYTESGARINLQETTGGELKKPCA